MSRLTESDDSLPVGEKWENMEFHSLPFPSSYSNSEHILISTLKLVSLSSRVSAYSGELDLEDTDANLHMHGPCCT